MHLTSDLLEAKGACSEQVKLFKQLFPKGCKVTEKLCLKHYKLFSWRWAANNLLSAQALAAYAQAMAPAYAAYGKAIVQACAAYDKATAQACAAYDKATAQAFGRLAEKEE